MNHSLRVSVAAFTVLPTLAMVSAVQASTPVSVTVAIANKTAHDFHLSSASWDLGDETPADFTVPAGVSGDFVIVLNNDQKDEAVFRYSSGGKTCMFTVGHGLKQSFGWLKPIYTPYQYADATSQGSFAAKCAAAVISLKPGVGYKVNVEMR
jgi:trehalose-6-phosphatase